MKIKRIIPCLLLRNNGLVKTKKFSDAVYIGDPINAVRIFNEKEVDELIFLDIDATKLKRTPNLQTIQNIATECFMPFSYGGGVESLDQIENIIKAGAEKIIINSNAFLKKGFIAEAAKKFGSSTIVVSVDVRKKLFDNYSVFIQGGSKNTGLKPVEYAKMFESEGAGEIFLNSVDRDGTMTGYDIELIRMVAEAVKIPVVACGGAGKLSDFSEAVNIGRASAVSAGSFFVFHGKRRAVLITYPSLGEISQLFNNSPDEKPRV